MSGCASRVAAADQPVFKVGTLPFGTVQWEIKTLLDNGFDTAAGIKVENVPLASSEAARIAFLSGSVDAIANDLLFAARLKAERRSVLYMPHSSTEGALMVAAASPIKTLADLKGKSIGVAGGPLDKSWLVLRASALSDAKLDLTKDAQPVFGAPPLLAAKVESGELESALLYWSQAARLSAKGYRTVASVEDLLIRIGAKDRVAIVGYLFKTETSSEVLAGFGKAIRRDGDPADG
jgi:ABC-type nitrate/sulfonate/bicarbonate transport systems, periplasmic components